MPESNTPQRVRTGPSRDMFGGPLLGVAAFLIIAVGIGWGLTKMFQGMLDQTAQTLQADELDHGFAPDTVYLTQKELFLGKRSGNDTVLLPAKEDLPPHTPNRGFIPTTAQYRKSSNPQADYPDLLGIVERNTPVRFVQVIDDRNNAQTRLLVMVQIIDGPFAQADPVLGMHLESADTDAQTGERRYVPHPDLFAPVKPTNPPVQSPIDERVSD